MSEQQDAAIAYALRLAVEQHEGNLNLGKVNHDAENDMKANSVNHGRRYTSHL